MCLVYVIRTLVTDDHVKYARSSTHLSQPLIDRNVALQLHNITLYRLYFH